MSNYSDFFGVGSSGGGGALPINTYTPFLVGGSTGNPSGYDVTTGLYTHPDGTFWLETGKTIVDTSGTYSDATIVTTLGGDYINPNSGVYDGAATTPGGQAFANQNTNIIGQAGVFGTDSYGNPAGNFASWPASIRTSLDYDLANSQGVQLEPGSDTVYELNGTGYSGVSWTTTAQTGAPQAVTIGGGFIYVATAAGSIFEYSPGGTFNQNIGNIGALNDFHKNPSGRWYTTTNTTVSEFNVSGTTFTATGVTRTHGINPTANFGVSLGNGRDQRFMKIVGSSQRSAIIINDRVGDSTARTSTDTSQPLFIRIK